MAQIKLPIAPIFYGIRLGESGSDVYARLGKPALNVTTNHGPTWAYSIQRNAGWLVILFQKGVVASINVLPQAEQTAKLSDPSGVRVGDSLKRLIAVRGQAAGFADPNIYYYGDAGEPGWIYGLWNGAVLSIGVTTGETNIPALIIDWRRDGVIPERAIVLQKRANLRIENQELNRLNAYGCEDTGVWQIVSKHKVVFEGDTLDAVRVSCSVSMLERTFYFQLRN